MKAVIIGGNGKMGRMFQRLLSHWDYSVEVLEENNWDDAESILACAQIVLISVPIMQITSIIQRASPYFYKDTLLVDITSIKRLPLDSMLHCHTGPVLALHPMFGPSLEFSAEGRLKKPYRIVNCGGRDLEKAKSFLEKLVSLGFEIIDMSADEHDVLTAYMQGLQYFSVFLETSFIYKKYITLKKSQLLIEAPKDLFLAALKQGKNSRDDTIRNAYNEIVIMFQDASKQDLYEGLLFSCKDRLSLYQQFLKTAEMLLQVSVQEVRARFLENIKGLREFFSDILAIEKTIQLDLDSPFARLHYFLIFCEAILLCKDEINKENLSKISTANYLMKLSAIGHLLNAEPIEKVALQLFSEDSLREYRQAITNTNWIYSKVPIEFFKKEYPRISALINSNRHFSNQHEVIPQKPTPSKL